MDDGNCPTRIPGFTHNGDCNLICKQSDWKDILIFFLGNYGAHAATVIGRPGQSSLTWTFSLVLALLFPGAGVLTGVTAIASLALFAPTELTRAARAGALCIVVKADGHLGAEQDAEASHQQQISPPAHDRTSRSSQEGCTQSPLETDQERQLAPDLQEEEHGESRHEKHVEIGETTEPVLGPRTDHVGLVPPSTTRYQQSVPETRETLNGRADEILPSSMVASRVHGVARLPAGYRLLVLPGWTSFEHDDDGDDDKHSTSPAPESFSGRMQHYMLSSFKSQNRLTSKLPCSYNAIKALISIGQLLFSVLTLYETRGNQIAVFGYAAFGLTAAPYFWMSLVNLLGNLMCPQYPNIFIVNSPTLDRLRREAEDKGLSHRYPFDGTVGRISDETEARVLDVNGHLLKYTTALEVFFNRVDPEKGTDTWTLVCHAIVAYVVAAVPIAIVGGLSRFDAGHSAAYQRVWTMIWLCFGPMVGIGYGLCVLPLFESWPVLWRTMMIHKADELSEEALALGHEKKTTIHRSQEDENIQDQQDTRPPNGTAEARSEAAPRFVIGIQIARFTLAAVFVSVYAVPAIGGFVVVGQMLMQYGTCKKMV